MTDNCNVLQTISENNRKVYNNKRAVFIGVLHLIK